MSQERLAYLLDELRRRIESEARIPWNELDQEHYPSCLNRMITDLIREVMPNATRPPVVLRTNEHGIQMLMLVGPPIGGWPSWKHRWVTVRRQTRTDSPVRNAATGKTFLMPTVAWEELQYGSDPQLRQQILDNLGEWIRWVQSADFANTIRRNDCYSAELIGNHIPNPTAAPLSAIQIAAKVWRSRYAYDDKGKPREAARRAAIRLMEAGKLPANKEGRDSYVVDRDQLQLLSETEPNREPEPDVKSV